MEEVTDVKKAVLAFGSNLGNRLENLRLATELVNNLPATKIVKISNIYETEPIDTIQKQNFYLNCCAKVETKLCPQILLNNCLKIETQLGRKRPYKNAPRTIDIDLILYGNVKIDTENLVIPHPRWKNRAFVIVPMLDVYVGGITDGGLNLKDILNSIEDQQIVKLFLEKLVLSKVR